MSEEQMAAVAKGLAHPARIRIVQLLAAQTECRGHEVFSELPLAQSTISEHLRILKQAGLVKSQSIGTAMVYCLITSVLVEFQQSLGTLTTDAVPCNPGRGRGV